MCVVVNLWGGPGCGKSTTMAAIFTEFKIKGYNVEMVSEFAKDLVYEKRDETMKDELYIFAKQNHRLFRVKDKVDIIVTDRPLPLTCVYDEVYGKNDKALHELVRNTFKEYNNINIFLNFNEENYKKEGRLQEKTEALDLHEKIMQELIKNQESYLVAENNKIKDIINYIEEELEEQPVDWNNVLPGTNVYVRNKENNVWEKAIYLCFEPGYNYKHFVYLLDERMANHYRYAKLKLNE
jgi:thymidylate kinase